MKMSTMRPESESQQLTIVLLPCLAPAKPDSAHLEKERQEWKQGQQMCDVEQSLLFYLPAYTRCWRHNNNLSFAQNVTCLAFKCRILRTRTSFGSCLAFAIWNRIEHRPGILPILLLYSGYVSYFLVYIPIPAANYQISCFSVFANCQIEMTFT